MYKRFTLFLSLLVVFCMVSPSLAQDSSIDIVDITGGQVQGVDSEFVEGVQVFKGIPFAGPTGGENRWKAPQPVEAWEGVMVADTWGDQVLQVVDLNPPGTFYGDEFYANSDYLPPASEDGLYLNVWTPAQSADENLPVFVYIHGGGNDHGFASEMEFEASKLAEKGIIVVTVSYRVGVFGFLALPELSAESEDGVSGNYALLDLIQSLQWVQDNIAGFGGDSSRVTIGGQSAGAMNSTALLRSPLAEGLFQGAVIMSGFSGFFDSSYPALADKEEASAASLTEIFGKEMTLEELRAIPADDFFTVMAANGDGTLYNALDNAITGYTVDGYVFTDESVALLEEGALDGYNIMIGGTSNELTSLFGVPPETTMALDEYQTTMEGLGYPADQTAYQPDTELEAYRMYLQAWNDRVFQTYLLSSELAANSSPDADIYAYFFDHEPPGRDADFYGAWHSSDLWYWFNSMRPIEGQRYWTSADYRMGDVMTSYLANFVTTGDPNGEDLPTWETLTMGNTNFVRFADGYAYAVDETPYPDRDAINREIIMASKGLTEADFQQ